MWINIWLIYNWGSLINSSLYLRPFNRNPLAVSTPGTLRVLSLLNLLCRVLYVDAQALLTTPCQEVARIKTIIPDQAGIMFTWMPEPQVIRTLQPPFWQSPCMSKPFKTTFKWAVGTCACEPCKTLFNYNYIPLSSYLQPNCTFWAFALCQWRQIRKNVAWRNSDTLIHVSTCRHLYVLGSFSYSRDVCMVCFQSLRFWFAT